MNKIFKTAITTGLLGVLISCGGNGGSDDSASGPGPMERSEEVLPPDGSNIDGLYQAKFVTLNPQVNGTIPGSFTFYRKDDRVMIYGRLFAGYPKAWHQQYIHIGSRCPTAQDDLNGDGFIDIVEARKVLGKIIIPLDSDPGSQASGARFFPLGDLSGSYHYERVVSFKRLFRDLKAPDKNPDDEIMKLQPDQGFSIEGRAVIVHGVADTVEFPETVQSAGRFQAYQTLPIACGVFRKVTEEPGEYPDGSGGPIPGPVAEVEEGQDRPADERPETGGSDEGPRREGNGSNSTEEGEFGDGGSGRISGGRSTPDREAPSRPRNDDEDASSSPTEENETERRPRPTPTPTPTPSPESAPESEAESNETEAEEAETTRTESRRRSGGRNSLGSSNNSNSNRTAENVNRVFDWWTDHWKDLKGTDHPTLWADEVGEVNHIR